MLSKKMANWCSNELKILGDRKQIKKLASKLGNNLDFDKVLSIPKNYKKDDRWYDWCIKNWGTKWSPSPESISIDCDDDYEYFNASFDTAWSPPIEFFENVSKIYPELVFILRYVEEGVGFTGVTKITKGKALDYNFNF